MSGLAAESILASIAKVMRDIGPPPKYSEARVGSLRYLPPATRPEYRGPVAGPMSLYGMPIHLDLNIPKYLGYMVGPDRGFLKPRDYVIIDFRRHPRTDDMAQMLDDLRRFNAVPKP